MIFLSIDTRHLSRMIYFLAHHVLLVQTLTGKFPFRNGLPFFIVLTRANPSDKLQVTMVSRMRQSDVSFVLLPGFKQAEAGRFVR